MPRLRRGKRQDGHLPRQRQAGRLRVAGRCNVVRGRLPPLPVQLSVGIFGPAVAGQAGIAPEGRGRAMWSDWAPLAMIAVVAALWLFTGGGGGG